MGSGGMIVLDDRTCIVDLARYYLHFLEEESCRRYVPNRAGTRRMSSFSSRTASGLAEEGDLARLESLALTVKTASLCGLETDGGQSRPFHRGPFPRGIEENPYPGKRCPAGVCRDLVSPPSARPAGKRSGRENLIDGRTATPRARRSLTPPGRWGFRSRRSTITAPRSLCRLPDLPGRVAGRRLPPRPAPRWSRRG